MKIPETSANIGAYYGNEENGQWQPNGVILDSGVGGGVVGSGDAGVHRPPVYPVHLPRGHHIPGYVMAGAYYPPAAYPPVPPPVQDDFADYMWMENEEEFDKQVMQQLEEEALMEQCIEAMLEDEQRERQHRPLANGHNHHVPTTSNGNASISLEEAVSRSTLNPLAAEFVPTRRPPPPTHIEENQLQPETQSQPETQKSEESQAHTEPQPQGETEECKREVIEESKVDGKVPEVTPPETPEVSAADILPITDKDKRPKDVKKDVKPKVDIKKTVKVVDAKLKPKPQVVKSEVKVQPKKKEVRAVKSDIKMDEKSEEIIVCDNPVELSKSQPDEPAGPKPINYAAAAKANKPKPKPMTPPVVEKTPSPPKFEKPKTPVEKKDKPKVEKPMQRKNSAK